jgi:hypothetical protein
MDKDTMLIIGGWTGYAVFVIAVVAIMGTVHYEPTQIESPYIVRTSNNTIQYGLTLTTGYPESEVNFSHCAFALLVNGQATQPMDLKLQNVIAFTSQEIGARSVKGAGTLNAHVMTQRNMSYIVTFFDPDCNGIVGPGDYVIVQCTEPLSPGSSYSLYVFTDIDGTRGIGMIYGTYSA